MQEAQRDMLKGDTWAKAFRKRTSLFKYIIKTL